MIQWLKKLFGRGTDFWQCPKCGAVLAKPAGMHEFTNVMGTIRCGNCKTAFNAADMQKGAFDTHVG